MVQMSASESLPNLVNCNFTLFFPAFPDHPMKQSFFEMVSHMSILPPHFLKYNAHSLSSLKSNCISKSRVCKNNLCMTKRCSQKGEKGNEGGATLLLFTEENKTPPLEKASEKVTTQSLVHPTA